MRTLILAAMLGTMAVAQHSDDTVQQIRDRANGDPALIVTAASDQCAIATTLELWRKSSEPIPHRPDQRAEIVGFGPEGAGRVVVYANRATTRQS